MNRCVFCFLFLSFTSTKHQIWEIQRTRNPRDNDALVAKWLRFQFPQVPWLVQEDSPETQVSEHLGMGLTYVALTGQVKLGEWQGAPGWRGAASASQGLWSSVSNQCPWAKTQITKDETTNHLQANEVCPGSRSTPSSSTSQLLAKSAQRQSIRPSEDQHHRTTP